MEAEGQLTDPNGPGLTGPDPNSSSGAFDPSGKLRARIESLEGWRIDPSSIEFDEGGLESRGGHATVSRGHQKTGHQNATPDDVAVKKMRVADDMDFERVLGLAIRETELLAELDHRNIVKLRGFAEDISKSIIWLVFPWAKCGTLRDFIASENCEIPEKIFLIDDVARGLAYLHGRNPPVCHGDLKSLNVLVYTNDGYEDIYATITDFGSARRFPQQGGPAVDTILESQFLPVNSPRARFNTSTNTITLTGNNYTLRWAAPELLLEDQLSLWSDIWALGWIAYEVMTGFLPFEDVTSDIGVVERVIEGRLPSLVDDANLALINELCSLMEMCWKIRPTERPTANSCRKAISGIVREPGGPVHVTKKDGTVGGTYADIYKGELEQPDGSKIGVAIKRIRYYSELQNVEAVSKRVRKEAFIWMSANHPNILPFIGYKLVDGDHYLVSPWCQHGSLARYISANRGMRDSAKLKLLCDAARGLVYLHSMNPAIIHGDIKPENVLVMDNLDGALCDFGVSRLFAGIWKAGGLTTAENRTGGTPGYQAKELLVEGMGPSAPGDLYAFGGLILATMSGKNPFWKRKNDAARIVAVCLGQTPSPRDHPGLPSTDPLWALLQKCWNEDPAERPTIYAVLQELESERDRRAASGN